MQNNEILNFIKKELVPQGVVSTCARPKPLAPFAVAEDLIKFLFSCDEHTHMHSRLRNQIAFVIQVLLNISARLGEVIESDAWTDSNKGLKYEDIQLVHQHTPAFTGWTIYVTLRNCKGNREYKKHAYGK